MKPKPADLLIIAFNLVPLAGVWLFGWQAFDIVFLYWMENVVIGAFTLLRMVVRPYQHVIDVLPTVFFGPFFVVHFGMFCYVHGLFVVSMFGNEDAFSGGLAEQAMLILLQPGMTLALLSLVALQVFDWLRDVSDQGLGGDGIKDLMTKPYRRIVVLHLAIIGGGFALTALGDPVAGLVLLIVIKTVSDIYHDRRSHASGEKSEEPLELTPEQWAEMHEQFSEPVVTINGKEKRYISFAEMKRSKEFRMLKSVMRLMGAGSKLRVIERFLDQKIAEEQAPDGLSVRQ